MEAAYRKFHGRVKLNSRETVSNQPALLLNAEHFISEIRAEYFNCLIS
jgi:hypothetical protein